MARANFDFIGENYVVAGASSGLGRATALKLAESGAKILAIGRNIERLENLREENPERIFPARVDIVNAEDFEAAVKNFVQLHGKLKGGVYSAGIVEYTPVRSYNRNAAEQMLQIGFWAATDFLKIILKPKYCAAPASVVLLSSIAALTNEKGLLVYSAMKAALNSAVKTAAKEISPKGHRINSVCPGFVNSPMTEEFLENEPSVAQAHPLGLGEPEDVANAALFLLSEAARWITGTNLIVDGGYTA